MEGIRRDNHFVAPTAAEEQAPVRGNRKGPSKFTFSKNHTKEAKDIKHFTTLLEEETQAKTLLKALRLQLELKYAPAETLNQYDEKIRICDENIARMNSKIALSKRSLEDRQRLFKDPLYPYPLTRDVNADAEAKEELNKN